MKNVVFSCLGMIILFYGILFNSIIHIIFIGTIFGGLLFD